MLDLSCLRPSQDKLGVMLKIAPQSSAVSEIDIRALLMRSDFSQYLIDQEALQEAVDKFTQLREQPDLADEWGDTEVKLASAKNAEVEVTISEDRMVAWATITAAHGGRPIGHRDLVVAMQEAGIQFGLQKRRATELIHFGQKAEPGSTIKRVVALGRHPENGEDSRFERLVDTPLERVRRPKELDHGQVDMRDLGDLGTVKPGTTLMRRHPHILGREGMNVTGQALPHKAGKELALLPGDGTEISPSDPELLIATRNGLPLVVKQGMKVDDVLSVKTVDVGYGHVDFEGSIHITGDVAEGMRVSATGDVHINGFVESAHIEAGGDVVVGKGIIGHRREELDELSCSVSAGGSISATFAQYADLQSEGDVLISSQLLHSNINSKASVLVRDEQGFKGTLVGGKVQAANTIECVVLGATAGTSTSLHIEGEISEIREEYQSFVRTKNVLAERISKILDAQLRLSTQRNGNDETSQRLAVTLSHSQEEFARTSYAIECSLEKEEAFFDKAKIIASKELHPNVYLDVAGFMAVSRRQYGPSETKVEKGKLLLEPLQNPNQKK